MVTPRAIPLPASFRGSRTYLTGATLFDLLRSSTGAKKNVELKCSRLMTEAVRALEVDASKATHGGFGVFSYSADGAKRTWNLVADPAVAAPGRVPCNEMAILERSELKSGQIFVEFAEGGTGTLVENVVALNKKMIETFHSPAGKLYFTQVFMAWLPKAGTLGLKLQTHVGTKLFVSEMTMDGENFGKITFVAK